MLFVNKELLFVIAINIRNKSIFAILVIFYLYKVIKKMKTL